MRYIQYCSTSLVVLVLSTNFSFGGDPLHHSKERPTCNQDTCDPRPDILPYWLTSWHTEYRRQYNRPTYIGGKIAHCIEPTSQEAMVWCEANQMGLYNGKNCPPMYKQYYYPKPWELIPMGPRPEGNKPVTQLTSTANRMAVRTAVDDASIRDAESNRSSRHSDRDDDSVNASAKIQSAQQLRLN